MDKNVGYVFRAFQLENNGLNKISGHSAAHTARRVPSLKLPFCRAGGYGASCTLFIVVWLGAASCQKEVISEDACHSRQERLAQERRIVLASLSALCRRRRCQFRRHLVVPPAAIVSTVQSARLSRSGWVPGIRGGHSELRSCESFSMKQWVL